MTTHEYDRWCDLQTDDRDETGALLGIDCSVPLTELEWRFIQYLLAAEGMPLEPHPTARQVDDDADKDVPF
jgi:hypothetical protein